MADNENPTPKPDDEGAKPEELGAGGKAAIQAERDARAAEKKRADEAEAKLKAIEDKDKDEVTRLTESNAALTKQLADKSTEAARLAVALDKGLNKTQAKRLVGSTEEELAADADELLADLGAKPKADEKPADEKDGAKPPAGGKPVEDLKPGGADPETPVVETDVKKIGERMFAR